MHEGSPDLFPRRPSGNLFLDALGEAAYRTIAPGLRPIRLERGEVVARRARAPRHAVFPVSAIVVLHERIGRQRIEVLTVGNEAVVGYWGATGEELDVDIVCAAAGLAYTLPVRALVRAVVQSPELAGALHALTWSSGAQLIRNVACVAAHTLAQRCGRALLEMSLRLGDRFELTHETLARALNVTRPSITREMHLLAADRTIEYRRGEVRIIDRGRLERHACVCVQTLVERRGRLGGLPA